MFAGIFTGSLSGLYIGLAVVVFIVSIVTVIVIYKLRTKTGLCWSQVTLDIGYSILLVYKFHITEFTNTAFKSSKIKSEI